MSAESRFDLEAAIATWRRFMTSDRAISADDADELESHLRDQIDELIADGGEPRAAFRQAAGQLGSYTDLKQDYRRVYWKKLRSEHRILDELNWRSTMLKNYVKVALRAMRKQKAYAFINVLGLSIGMACCCFIFLYVQDEFSYDRYHANADRIVRIAEDLKTSSETLYQATSSPPMGAAFVKDFPEVLDKVRFTSTGGLFQYQDRRFQEDNLFFADSSVFEVFSFALLQGDPKTALVAPWSMVLTEAAARKYFEEESPLGKTLTDEDDNTFTITGILAEVPPTSHFTFDGLISFTTWETFYPDTDDAWFWNAFYTYLLLQEGTDKARLEAKIPDFIERHMGEQSRQIGMGYAMLPLIPLTDIHLTSHRTWELATNGNRAYLYIFSAVAVFILLIACINFMNLATARSAERAKEVGLRKVVGARRAQLTGQFLSESFLMTLLAMLLALGLCGVLMPFFNTLTEKTLGLGSLLNGTNVAWLVGIVLVVGAVAGGYPALVLSGFRPARVLKGEFRSTDQGTWLRKGLVVFQFAISMILIVGTAVVMRQLSYLQAQNLGFTQEQMLVINYNYDNEVQRHAEAIKQAFLTHPGVVHAAISMTAPGTEPTNLFTRVEVDEGDEREANLNYYPVDFDFINTYDLEILAGRGFSRDFPADTLESIVINEAMLAHFGWATPEEALDKNFMRGRQTRKVIGVVKDFNYRSLHEHVQPLGLFIGPGWTRYLSLRLRTDQVQRTMAEVEQQWKALVPHRPFDAFFLDDHFNRQYRAEERFASLFRYFAGLGILIACLGLFGLASFTAQQRTKEIGVRKVLGASVGQILVLLSKDFARLVLVAFVVAVPVAYFAMDRWLVSFAYRVGMEAWLFVVAGLLAFVIAGLTVSYQALKAAYANPVEALRYE